MKCFLFTLFLCGFAIPHIFAHPIDAGDCITTVVDDRILTEQLEHCEPGCAKPGLHGHKYVPLRQPAGGGYGVNTGYIDSSFGEGHSEWNRYIAQFHDCSETDGIWKQLTKQLSNGSTRQTAPKDATPDGTSRPQPDTHTRLDSSDAPNLSPRQSDTHTRVDSSDVPDPTPPQQQTEPSIDVQPEPPQQREPEASEPEVVMPSPLALSYDHIFPEGISLHHIPIDTDYGSVGSVFDALGNAVDYLAASRGASGWTYIKKRGQFGGALWKSIAFLAVMNEEATLEMSGHFNNWDGTGITYAQLVLRQGGLTLLGIPLRSESLETVGDFFTFFRGVKSVKGIDPDLTIESAGDYVTEDWFVELDADTVIEGTAAYLVEAEMQTRSLWGVPWAYEPPSSAPPAEQWAYYKKMATTWGRIKAGDLYRD